MKIIGIIGGFGPETTAEFYMSIVNKNRKINLTHPNIIIHNVPVPFDLEKSAVMDGKKLENFLPLLLDSVRLLENRCDILVLPCNTLHIFIDNLRKACSKPFLSIIEETSEEIKRRKIDKIGLLSTAKTADSGILESKLSGVMVLKLPERCQSRLSEIIHGILRGESSPEMKQDLVDMVNELGNKGAEAVVLGCTDLQLLLRQTDVDTPLIDTMDILANSIIRHISDTNA